MQFYYTLDASTDIPRYMPRDVCYMLPASSWHRVKMRTPRLPDGVQTAADCGGFVATFKWGDYRYSPEQYVEWLHRFNPEWAATMDYCCENEITNGTPGIVRERQQRTSEMAYRFWNDYRDSKWSWVPTVQGWEVEDYRYHARELKPLLHEMQSRSGPHWRVGIGTLCRRASVEMVVQVIRAVRDELGDMPLHLWGVKLGVLQKNLHLDGVVSVDSGAWHGSWDKGVTKSWAWQESGMTKREWNFKVGLPNYRQKVEAATMQPKQMSMALAA